MSRRSSRENDCSDVDHSDYVYQPSRSERDPSYDAPRKRPVPPPSSRRSRDRDDEVEERRPPVNRDSLERRPPPGRSDRGERERDDLRDRYGDRDRDASRERSTSRSASRDRPLERPASRNREYDDDGGGGQNHSRRPPPVRTSRDPDEDYTRGGRDRGSRNNSRDRYQDDDDDDLYEPLHQPRDRAVRSSREGGEVRRSREAPKGFTPKSYMRPNGTPPASAWNDNSSGSGGQRQFEKENTRPSEGDFRSSSTQRSTHAFRDKYADDLSDEEEYRDRGRGRVEEHVGREHQSRNRNRGESDDYRERGRTAREEGGGDWNKGRGREPSGDRHRGGGRSEVERVVDLEESQDNNITPFSAEKPKPRKAPMRQPSPEYAGERGHSDSENDEPRRGDWDREQRGRRYREEEERMDDGYYRGDRDRDKDRDANVDAREGAGNRKWHDEGIDDSGITTNDMQRLDNFRKSGRYNPDTASGGDASAGGAGAGGYKYKPSGNVPIVHYCPPNGGNTDLFQCYIVRERTSISSKLYPTYKLYSQEDDKLLLLARKMSMNSTSNYHLFDMTRGIPEKTQLSKKSGNYIGKLRGIDTNHSEYVLVTKSEDKHEVAAIQFDRLGLVNQLKEGCQPRKMNILLPTVNADNEPIPHQLKHTDRSQKKPRSLATLLRRNELGNKFNLVSKDPIYENGNYRLNFHGRVSIPSVKNFQLTNHDDIDDVICQFGKIGDETFNLDFKYPLNPFQAFSVALCHFDA